MTEVTAYPDSGVVQDGDTLWLARAGVGYRVAGTRLVRTQSNGSVILSPSGDEKLRLSGSNAPYISGYDSTGSTRRGYILIGASATNIVSESGGVALYATGAQIATFTNTTAYFNASANILFGVSTGNYHRICKDTPRNAGNPIATFEVLGVQVNCVICAVTGSGWNSANTCLKVGHDGVTGRAVNASGTINASGADYAEYMTKAPDCAIIAKADVCGVNADGELVTKWVDAVQFRIKSTSPNLVGGDLWGGEDKIGARPERPIEPEPPLPFDDNGPELLPIPDAPEEFSAQRPLDPVRGSADDIAWARMVNDFVVADARWVTARDQYAAALADYPKLCAEIAQENAARQSAYDEAKAEHEAAADAYQQSKADYDAEVAAYEDAMAGHEARLEAARVKVDRIAYCGQVPVNFAGEFAAGDYLVAVQDGDGIGLECVTPAEMVADLVAGGGLYLRRVGRVLRALDDGRPLIDVQHG